MLNIRMGYVEQIKNMNLQKSAGHIVIVDSKSIFCYSAAIALKKWNYRVSTAGDEKTAYKMLLRDDSIDLVLVDLLLSRASDHELILTLKKAGIARRVAVISTWLDEEQISELLRKGYAAFINKQVEPKDFVRQVELILQT